MSKQSKKKAARVRIAKALAGSSPAAATENKKGNVNPSSGETQEESQKRQSETVSITRNVITFCVTVVLGIVINKVSGVLWAWYIVAGVLCVLIALQTRSMKKARWALLPVYLIILIGTHKFIQNELVKGDSRKTVITVTKPDYIQGTAISHSQLDEIFPYGYKVIYFSENKLVKTEVLNTGKLQWKIDWDGVIVHPDIGANNVDWFLPIYSADMPNGEKVVQNISTLFHTLFKIGIFTPSPLGFVGKPCPFGLIISDNQQTPIFVIGFRILTADYLK